MQINTDPKMTREFKDETGRVWHAVGEEAIVAHGRKGAVLAFRPADEPGAALLRTQITFNSSAAAAFALRTLGENELRRRLSLARTEAVGL